MFSFLLKLLQQDPGVLSLMAKDPFQTAAAPKYIRILLYRYKFHKPKPGESDPPYWDRQLIGRVYPRIGVATISSLQDEIRKLQSQ
jgi:Lipase maturation factor